MQLRRTTHPAPSGFSLMELVIVVILLGFLGIIGAKMITNSVFTTQMISSGHLAYSTARYAMERMAREIRETQATVDVTGTNVPTFNSWSASSLEFVQTGLSTTSTQTVRFDYANPTLSMKSYQTGTTAPNGTALAKDITQFSFLYLKADGTTTANPLSDPLSSVRFVRISMTVAPATAPAQTLVTDVALRNP